MQNLSEYQSQSFAGIASQGIYGHNNQNEATNEFLDDQSCISEQSMPNKSNSRKSRHKGKKSSSSKKHINRTISSGMLKNSNQGLDLQAILRGAIADGNTSHNKTVQAHQMHSVSFQLKKTDQSIVQFGQEGCVEHFSVSNTQDLKKVSLLESILEDPADRYLYERLTVIPGPMNL